MQTCLSDKQNDMKLLYRLDEMQPWKFSHKMKYKKKTQHEQKSNHSAMGKVTARFDKNENMNTLF